MHLALLLWLKIHGKSKSMAVNLATTPHQGIKAKKLKKGGEAGRGIALRQAQLRQFHKSLNPKP